MTTFTGPLIVRRLDSDTTAAVIDAEGSATFTGNVRMASSLGVSGDIVVSGGIRSDGTVTAQGDINVSGNIIHNQTGDNAAAANVAMFVCNVTVNCQTATAGLTAKLATGATIHSIRYRRLDDVFSTAAMDGTLLIGSSGDDARYASLALDTAGALAYAEAGTTSVFTCSGVGMHGIASDQVIIKTTSVSGAVTSKNAFLQFIYTKP